MANINKNFTLTIEKAITYNAPTQSTQPSKCHIIKKKFTPRTAYYPKISIKKRTISAYQFYYPKYNFKKRSAPSAYKNTSEHTISAYRIQHTKFTSLTIYYLNVSVKKIRHINIKNYIINGLPPECTSEKTYNISTQKITSITIYYPKIS